MAQVGESHCIDRFEAFVVTEVREVSGKRRPVSYAVSEAGRAPTQGVSWRTAKEICAATAHGDGVKHLATSSEWEDAADGQVGPGGWAYPYGETWESGRCAVPDAGAAPLAMQAPPLTGSYPHCESRFGVFDQLGGAWEWVDPGGSYDLAAAVSKSGIELDGDTILAAPGATLEVVWPGKVELYGSPLSARLHGGQSQFQVPTRGWLHLADARLPVTLGTPEGAAREATLSLDRARDGEPLTEKRGGAYYSGAGVDVRYAYDGHDPDFIGSIGFRCAGPLM